MPGRGPEERGHPVMSPAVIREVRPEAKGWVAVTERDWVHRVNGVNWRSKLGIRGSLQEAEVGGVLSPGPVWATW